MALALCQREARLENRLSLSSYLRDTYICMFVLLCHFATLPLGGGGGEFAIWVPVQLNLQLGIFDTLAVASWSSS
jgi:hypothetical protein